MSAALCLAVYCVVSVSGQCCSQGSVILYVSHRWVSPPSECVCISWQTAGGWRRKLGAWWGHGASLWRHHVQGSGFLSSLPYLRVRGHVPRHSTTFNFQVSAASLVSAGWSPGPVQHRCRLMAPKCIGDWHWPWWWLTVPTMWWWLTVPAMWYWLTVPPYCAD